MCPVVLDKFNALLLLLPKLQVAVNGSGNQKLGPVAQCAQECQALASEVTHGYTPCHYIEVDHIPVHETLVVAVRVG